MIIYYKTYMLSVVMLLSGAVRSAATIVCAIISIRATIVCAASCTTVKTVLRIRRQWPRQHRVLLLINIQLIYNNTYIIYTSEIRSSHLCVEVVHGMFKQY